MSRIRPGVVSVVLVNFRGTDDTITAVRALKALDWPAELLEIVVVENASGDDSLARLKQVDGISLIESPENLGFAGGCNLGVANANGEFVAFSQSCTHLSCAVIPKVEEGVFFCPCHEGYFDLRTGRNIAGPPPRPLPRIVLEIEGEDIYAVRVDERTIV